MSDVLGRLDAFAHPGTVAVDFASAPVALDVMTDVSCSFEGRVKR